MTCEFAFLFVACFFVMKITRFIASRRPINERLGYLLFSPFLSTRVWLRRDCNEGDGLRKLFWRAAIVLPTAAVMYVYVPAYLTDHIQSWWARGYLAVLPFLVFAKAVEVVVELILMPFCGPLPPFFDKPQMSRSVSEFWGVRWNTWHGGWFSEVVLRLCRRRPAMGVVIAFALSGIWHELLIGLPLWNVFGQSVFGMTSAYFMIQAAGLLVGHWWLRDRAFSQRIWTWVVVILPIPLVLNRGTLLIFHLSLP